ncbi:hypothetical protein [Sphaerisporangium siamense]|uniref:Multisubunit Na+/H+ antiporter MnhC subunit n=1 Tax=Sphaerisporangium siamense TaxID=795645 RepID=A0A7W7D8M5_9ACTN|nr:hypothetical protein [Sphaerisporangium siamense]MBB4702034.1 multisubunit Na+/H+ antiporter MnhC subunit [Sphaerisporangium siamense]
MLDVIVGLLTALALPLAIVAIPNTISVVSALLPPDIAGVGVLRAHGLALPVMLCVVPLTAVALGRFSPAPVLLAGLALLGVADVAGGYAGSAVAVGVLRALHGVAAGMLVPATLAACRERSASSRGVLVPVWAAALAAAFLTAQALALWPLDQVTSWRVTLQPYPMLTGVALALAATYFAISRLTGEDTRPAEDGQWEGAPYAENGRRGGAWSAKDGQRGGASPYAENGQPGDARSAEGGQRSGASPYAANRRWGGARSAEDGQRGGGASFAQDGGREGAWFAQGFRAGSGGDLSGGSVRVLFTLGPSAGVALLALGTTFGWPPWLIVVSAAVAVAVLLTPACAGRAGGPAGRALAFVMVAVGLVVLPTAAQVTYVELGGLGGPGLSGLWAPFGLAVLLVLVVVLVIPAARFAPHVVGRFGEVPASKLVAGGLVAMVAGLCAIRLMVPAPSGMPLLVPFALLGGGAAVAVTAALRAVPLSTALSALSLCLPAVLSGFLLGTGIQVERLHAVSTSGEVTSQAMVDGFVEALHVWALVAGFAVVVILVLGAVLATRSAERALRDAPADTPADVPPRGVEDGADEGAADRAAAGEASGAGGAGGVVGPEGAGRTAGEEGAGDGPETSMIPVVPAPTRSPEAGGDQDGRDGEGSPGR